MTTTTNRLAWAAADFLAWAVSLVHEIHTHEEEDSEGTVRHLPAVFVFPLVDASPWRLAAMHERPADSSEGLGCVELRLLGCSVEVFYRPRQGQQVTARA